MRRTVATATLALMMATPAMSQDTQPSETTETFGAWTVRCRQVADTPRACELIHSVPSQNGVLAQIAFGTPPGARTYLIVVQLPLGVLVSSPIRLAVSNADKGIEAPFATCIQIGCLAQREVVEAELDELAAGQSAELQFAERTGKVVKVAVPLQGFKAALARLRAG